MSELEFELELDSENAYAEDHESDDDELSEGEDSVDGEMDDDSELEMAFEGELIEPDVKGFGERLHELSLREFESPQELDREIGDILHEMEQEFFFGKIGKLVKSAGKSLIKKGIAYAKKRVPLVGVIDGVTALARGNLTGALKGFAKTAMGALSAHPAFAAVMPALNALGFAPGGSPGTNKAAWGKFAQLGKDAYGQLAAGLTENADQPAEAARVAGRAYELALRGVKANGQARTSGNGKRTRVIHLRPGERLVIKA
jgi:hypothetical protein